MTVRCSSCGVQNPPEAAYCLRCGNRLAVAQSGVATPTRLFVASQGQATMNKMLETPGTIALTIGLLLLLFAIVAGAVGSWGWAIGLGFVSIIILYVAIQIRSHEARSAAAQAQYAPRIYQSTEIKEREIVKVKCRFCSTLNPDGARNCISCGAIL
jgi:ribosomal protein L40E